VTGLLAASSGRPSAVRAALIAAAAGPVNGAFAGLSKGMGDELDRGWLALLHSWLPWLLIIAAALGLILAARAFQVVAPVAAVTALFATEPLAGITIGAVVFGASVQAAPWTTLLELVAPAGCLAGVALLARGPVILATYAPG
jgi:hypothetical protein